MTDHGVSLDGPKGHTALFAAPDGVFEDHHDSSEGVASGSAVSSRVSSTRRRPFRSRSDPDVSPRSTSPQWVDTDNKKATRKAKRTRKTSRKSPGAESPHHSVSPKPASDDGTTDKERDSIGFLPKLSRILEGRESKSVRSSRSSVVGSSEKSTSARHRRLLKDGTVGPRSRRRTQTSLQRRAESLANLPNPSLVSVLSALTQHSHASSGSNSTVTQKSYDKGHISKRRPVQDRKRLQERKSTRNRKTMDHQPSDVFQYMEGDLEPIEPESDPRPVSPGQSSGSEAEDSEEGSDDEQEEGHPTTNYAAAHNPAPGGPVSDTHASLDDMASYGHDRFRSDSGVSFRKRRPDAPQQPPAPLPHEYARQHHPRHEVERDEEEEDEDEEEESDSEDEDHNEHGVPPSYAGFPAPPQHPGQHLMLHRDAPARMPSAASSSRSDPHLKRLRDQEQELRNHVLQPQPQRDIRFEGGFSPNTLALPLYGTHSPPTAEASPMGYHAAAPHPPPWTGLAPPPLPPTTNFYSPNYNVPPAPLPYAADNHHYSMATQPPPTTMTMTAPNDMLTTAPFHAPAQALAHHPPYAVAPQPAGPDLSRTTVVGYELLADKLASASSTSLPHEDRKSSAAPHPHHRPKHHDHDALTPLYRKFSQLNHRVLLHLQDELAELEEELRCADELVAQCVPRNEAGQVYPASRRGDARYGGELAYKRTEVLGRVYLKLGQYNQALASFSATLKNLDDARPEEVQRYRDWLERYAPIESHEARFLDRDDDLLAVSRPRPSGSSTASASAGAAAATAGGVASPHQRAAVGLPLIAVLPLMAFAIVPGLLARLFILTVIGAAEVAVVTSSELMGLMTVREWFVCASVYFGFMAVLAGVTG